MATTNKATEFFVNGHFCTVVNEGREHYSGYIDGDKICTGHGVYDTRRQLINDAKWRVGVEPDFWKICNAVHNFLQDQARLNGATRWVYQGTIQEQVTPCNTVGPTYNALLELEHLDAVEKEEIVMSSNVEKMFRAIEGVEPDIDDSLECPWTNYHSE